MGNRITDPWVASQIQNHLESQCNPVRTIRNHLRSMWNQSHQWKPSQRPIRTQSQTNRRSRRNQSVNKSEEMIVVRNDSPFQTFLMYNWTLTCVCGKDEDVFLIFELCSSNSSCEDFIDQLNDRLCCGHHGYCEITVGVVSKVTFKQTSRLHVNTNCSCRSSPAPYRPANISPTTGSNNPAPPISLPIDDNVIDCVKCEPFFYFIVKYWSVIYCFSFSFFIEMWFCWSCSFQFPVC